MGLKAGVFDFCCAREGAWQASAALLQETLSEWGGIWSPLHTEESLSSLKLRLPDLPV